MEKIDIIALKNIIKHQTVYLGNMQLVHELGTFFDLDNNSGMYICSLWNKIGYRLDKIMKLDKSLCKGKIKCITYFGKQDREIWHTAYWFEK